MTALATEEGVFKLERIPKTTKSDLRAWDAADELLLAHLSSNQLTSSVKISKPILIVNDAFAALSTALYQYEIHNWSDSYISHLAVIHNAKLNHLQTKSSCFCIPASQDLPDNYELVLIKIPKTLSLLEDQLCRLKPHISETATVLAGGMSKHIHVSTLKLFEKIIGTTKTSRATKKARLIFAQNNQEHLLQTPYPKTITDKTLNLTLINHANVFSKNHLDIGSRFLIEQLAGCRAANHIIDLGCGNGVLGIIAKRLQPEAMIHFVDESYMAIQSARENFNPENHTKQDSSTFTMSNCLSQYTGPQAQLVLCNPPFHQAHSIGDQIAWKMFQQSFNKLEKEGEIWVVGNRHLAYHAKLKRLFGNCRIIASNKKFAVLSGRK